MLWDVIGTGGGPCVAYTGRQRRNGRFSTARRLGRLYPQVSGLRLFLQYFRDYSGSA